MRYAYIVNGVVQEVFELPEGVTLADARESNFAAACVACGPDVAERDLYQGGAFSRPPAPTTDELAAAICLERNARISTCDWTQLPDAPLDETTKAAWAAYRQALRDVPEQAGFPQVVEWPVEPT